MAIGCNIWMICLKLNWYFYGLSRMFQLPQFVWVLRSSVWDVFINFLLIDATDRSKISGDQKRFVIALSLYPLSFFANTPFKWSRLIYLWLWITVKEAMLSDSGKYSCSLPHLASSYFPRAAVMVHVIQGKIYKSTTPLILLNASEILNNSFMDILTRNTFLFI